MCDRCWRDIYRVSIQWYYCDRIDYATSTHLPIQQRCPSLLHLTLSLLHNKVTGYAWAFRCASVGISGYRGSCGNLKCRSVEPWAHTAATGSENTSSVSN